MKSCWIVWLKDTAAALMSRTACDHEQVKKCIVVGPLSFHPPLSFRWFYNHIPLCARLLDKDPETQLCRGKDSLTLHSSALHSLMCQRIVHGSDGLRLAACLQDKRQRQPWVKTTERVRCWIKHFSSLPITKPSTSRKISVFAGSFLCFLAINVLPFTVKIIIIIKKKPLKNQFFSTSGLRPHVKSPWIQTGSPVIIVHLY